MVRLPRINRKESLVNSSQDKSSKIFKSSIVLNLNEAFFLKLYKGICRNDRFNYLLIYLCPKKSILSTVEVEDLLAQLPDCKIFFSKLFQITKWLSQRRKLSQAELMSKLYLKRQFGQMVEWTQKQIMRISKIKSRSIFEGK